MTAKIGSTIGTNDTAAAIENTRDLVNNGLDTLESGIEKLREAAPSVLSRAAAQVEDLTRRSMDRARHATHQVKEQVAKAGDRSADYIRDEPVKSVLIAAVAGAAVAALIGWLSRGRSDR
ncbi:MAG: hypothetical protein LCI02_00565 [Proteobacteria bacterium]|nr:hypothetical protein [Pseudomonadota bacterium]